MLVSLRCFPLFLFFSLFLGIPLAQADPVTFYVTDFGIKQWNEALRLGDAFGSASNKVFPEFSKAAQILVPMPADGEWQDPVALQAHFARVIHGKVTTGLAQGIDTFEIQFVQNINEAGYINADRQALVKEFGASAYKALGQVIDNVEQTGRQVGTYAIVGSNGTTMLTENIAHWQRNGQSYLKGVDFFDGRASFKATKATIAAIGQENVRFFNSKGDWPAPNHPGKRSIGNWQVVKRLQASYPSVRSYYLDLQSSDWDIGHGHITGMLFPQGKFRVREYRAGQGTFALPEPVQGHDLRPLTWGIDRYRAPLAPTQFSRTRLGRLGERLKGHIRVSRQAVEHLAAGVFAYANALKDVHERTLKRLPFMRNTSLTDRERQFFKAGVPVMRAYDLSRALEQDLTDGADGKWAFLRSYTLEAVGKVGLDLIGSLELEDHPLINTWTLGRVARLGAYQDFVTGAAKHLGRGRADLDVVEHYVNGVKELAKVSLQAQKKLRPNFLFLDGIQDLAFAGAHHSKTRRLDVDTVTRYVDAVNNLAWTGLGVAACGGSVGCTTAIQKLGTTAATIGRDSTQGFFNTGVLWGRKQHDQVITQWLSTQQRQIQLGLPIQKISQVYGADLLKQNGLSHKRVAELDLAVDQAMQARPHLPTQIPANEMGTVIDMAKLSDAVDQKVFVPFKGTDGRQWGHIHHERMRSGLEWSLYERQNAEGKTERVLAFAGTTSVKDWGTNFLQASIPPAQYQEALEVANRIAKQTHQDSDVSLVITGHSLGGGLAQYAALHTGTRAIVFNSAPLGLRSYPLDSGVLQAASSRITNVYMRGEPVRKIPGLQLGRTFELVPLSLTSQIDPEKTSGFNLGERISLHGQKLMISSLEMLQGAMRLSDRTLSAPNGLGQERQLGGVDLNTAKQAVIMEDLSGLKNRVLKEKNANSNSLFYDVEGE